MKYILILIFSFLTSFVYSQDKPFVTAGGGILWQRKYDSTAVANLRGFRLVEQSTAPTDTTVMWLDNSTGSFGVWPFKQRIKGTWQIIRWYDPILNVVSTERPLFVLVTGQSNAIPRCCGGDTTAHPLVAEFRNGVWTKAQTTYPVFNNIGLQFAKQFIRRTNRPVRFVIIAEASKPIEDWYPGGIKTGEIVAIRTAAHIDSFDVVLWRQGERNAELGDADTTYERKWNTVFTAYKDSTWFGKSCTVLAGGLNESYINTGVFNFFNRINTPEKSGRFYTGVSMLGLSRVDGIHISGSSIDTVGSRYAETLLGKESHYTLEKTPNVSWYNDSRLLITPNGSNSAAISLGRSSSQGLRGGFIKTDSTTAQMTVGWNETINATPSTDTVGIYVNSIGKVGFGKSNNTLTGNSAQVQIRANQPKAFDIRASLGNFAMTVDSNGCFNNTIYTYNSYAKEGELVFAHQSGDIVNGLIRMTRLNSPTTKTYRGVYWLFNGSSNLSILGSHGSTDTTWANDVPVLAWDESGIGVSIKTGATPTALLDIAANTTARGQIRLRAGATPTSPTDGSMWYVSNNLLISNGTTNFTFAKTLTNTATLDFPSTAAGNSSDLTVTVTGAADGDAVSIGVPNGSNSANCVYYAYVSATNTVTVRFMNDNMVSTVDPASGTFRVSVIKY